MTTWKVIFFCILGLTSIFTQNCITPNRVRSRCRRVLECEPLVKFLIFHVNKSVSTADRQYLNKISCHRDAAGSPRVCCAENDIFYYSTITGQTTTATPLPVPSQRKKNAKRTLPKPSKSECGVNIFTTRIFGGNTTELGEFPWMALLEYQKPITNVKSFSCGGSLINQRFVITAAHCVTGHILQVKGPLINIRLGEHNLNSPAHSVINVGISLTVSHPNYTHTSNMILNDIALVRLANSIASTQNIEPICFPRRNLRSPVGKRLTVSGWGRTETASKSQVKLKANVPIVEFTNCQQTFRQMILHKKTQICAGGELGIDSCQGDSGGPLMVIVGKLWYLEGIVSFGQSPCGIPGIPGIYTKVNSYTKWITSVLNAPYIDIGGLIRFQSSSAEDNDDEEDEESEENDNEEDTNWNDQSVNLQG